MINSILTINNSTYDNEDAIDKTIDYIYRIPQSINLPIYCYGIINPSYDNIIAQFHEIRNCSDNPPDRQVWHFEISFDQKSIDLHCKHFIDNIAYSLGLYYQVCYSYHNDTTHYHAHFVVSATSYHPSHTDLDAIQMNHYLEQFISIGRSMDIELHIENKSQEVLTNV